MLDEVGGDDSGLVPWDRSANMKYWEFGGEDFYTQTFLFSFVQENVINYCDSDASLVVFDDLTLYWPSNYFIKVGSVF